MNRIFTTACITLACLCSAVFSQIPRSLYVVNTLGENLSMINLETHTVAPNVEPLGLFTNQVVIRNESAFVINSGENEIQIIDLATLNTVNTIDAGSGTNPYNMAFVNDSVAAVSRLITNELAFVNVFTEQIVQVVSVGTSPQGVLVAGGKVYVANSGFNGSGYDPGVISVVQTNNYSVSEISVGLNPQSLAVDTQGNIVVACSGNFSTVSGQMDVIDPANEVVIHSAAANAFITNVAVNGLDKAYLATTGSGVLVYDLAGQNFERDASNPLPGGPGVAFDHQNTAYLADFATDSVYAYTEDHTRIRGYQVGDGPLSLAIYDPSPNSVIPPSNRIIKELVLYRNYPNPFNPATTIAFEVARENHIRLEIFDILGKKVRTLVNDILPPGFYKTSWDGKDDSGGNAPSGVYIYQLTAGNGSQSKQMQLIR